MNRLKKWFGVSDYFPADADFSETKEKMQSDQPLDGTSNANGNKEYSDEHLLHQVSKKTLLGDVNITQEYEDKLEHWIRQHTRIKPEDCVGCLAVRSFVATFFAGIVMTKIPQLKTRLPPRFKYVPLACNGVVGLIYLDCLRRIWFHDIPVPIDNLQPQSNTKDRPS